uniref:Peptidase S1 domain-containing protein n=1 Tax=Pseudonaja textilis TaxID=8673 RepID=A0A670ZMW6_PSETE
AKKPGVYARITKLKSWILGAISSCLSTAEPLRARSPSASTASGPEQSPTSLATSGLEAACQEMPSGRAAGPDSASQPLPRNSGPLWGKRAGPLSWTHLLNPPPPAVPCTPSTFKCSNKVCIGKANPECDGIIDCGNGWDETGCNCGLGPLAAFSKIVGGSGAAQGEWPWQASLWLRRRQHACGAVVIAERWLLSAAHCFDVTWVAVLGTPFLSGLDGRVEKIARIHKHPFYNGYMLDYDVALLELATPLRYTSTVRPICLPDRTHVFSEGRPCVITGWGSTKEGGTDVPQNTRLQKAAVQVIREQDCWRFYPIQISSRMLCAGFPQGGIDSCSGDAGGPLACREPSGRWFLAGITSWGYGCARPSFPGVYAKVTAVRGWIAQNLKALFHCWPMEQGSATAPYLAQTSFAALPQSRGTARPSSRMPPNQGPRRSAACVGVGCHVRKPTRCQGAGGGGFGCEKSPAAGNGQRAALASASLKGGGAEVGPQ